MGSTVSIINDFDDGRHIVVGLGVQVYAAVFGTLGGTLGVAAAAYAAVGAAAGVAALIDSGVIVEIAGPSLTTVEAILTLAGDGLATASVELAPLAGEGAAEVSGAMSEAGSEVADAFAETVKAASSAGTQASAQLITTLGTNYPFYGGMVECINVLADELPGVINEMSASATEMSGAGGINRFSALAKLPISDKSKGKLLIALINTTKNKKPEDRTKSEKAEIKTLDKVSTKAMAGTLAKEANNGNVGDPNNNQYSENTVALAAGESTRWPATLSLVRTARVVSVNYIDGELKLAKGSKDMWTGGTANSDIRYSSKNDITLEATTLKDL